jgi:hypothetical protein
LQVDGKPAMDGRRAPSLNSARCPVTLLPRSVAFAYYDHNMVSVMEG